MAMPYKHIIENCFTEQIGTGGISNEAYCRYVAEGSKALAEIARSVDTEFQTVLEIPERRDDLREIQRVADQLRENCDELIVVGTGGSSLGSRTLCALRGAGALRLRFLENIDPDGIDQLLDTINPKRTGAIFVSKSGGTTETISLSMILLELLAKNTSNTSLAERCVAITERCDNPLHKLATHFDIPLVEHDPNIGGRFSVFSSVGLLPAAAAGLNILAVREGARELTSVCLEAPETAAPAAGASLAAAFAAEKKISISVLMPYRDKLEDLALWYRQLWAESLGKNGRGTTPVQAAGTVDQHSQLQLYLDGPADKLFSLVTCHTANTGRQIPVEMACDIGLEHLGGRRVGDLLDVFSSATAQAIARHGRPVREFRLEALNERSLGALMMHFVLETLIVAKLWGVNPFDQPAIESGKAMALAHLSS